MFASSASIKRGNMKARRITLLLTSMALAVMLAGEVSPESYSAQAQAQARPNLVFVVMDDMRDNELRFMPKMRKFFEGGVSFENFFTTTPSCCPSRASFFTGKYAHNHKVFNNVAPLCGYSKFVSAGQESQTIVTPPSNGN